jgi:hypothetical protein
MKTKIKRVPRPFGTTILNQNQNKKELVTHIIKLYIQNQYKLHNTIYNIQDIAKYLQITEVEVMGHIVEINKSMMEGLSDPKTQEGIFQSLVGQLLNWAFGDRLRLERQLEIIGQSQGNKYRAYVTTEYNALLNTLLKSHGGLLEVAKLIKPIQGPKALPIPANTQNIQGTVIYNNGVSSPALGSEAMGSEPLTVEKALKLINESASGLNLDSLIGYTEGAPEVVAIGQETGKSNLLSLSMDEEVPTHEDFKANQAGIDNLADHTE